MKSKYDDLSEEELIERIRMKSKELGGKITDRDLCLKNDLPSRKKVFKILNVNTMTDLLKKCGLTINKHLNYTQIELIKLLQNRSRELGKSPSKNDFGKKYNLPSIKIFYSVFKTNSWNKILNIAGLELNHIQGYSKEYAILRLQELSNKLNRIPKSTDIKKYNWSPSLDVYYNIFGNYKKACLEAGLINNIYTKQERIDISINELIKLANELKRVPTVNEYENIKHDGVNRRALENNLELKYNDICRKYLPQYSLNFIHGDFTIDDVRNKIFEVINIINKIPSFEEFKKYGGYSYSLFKRVSGGKTYNQIIEDMGLIPYGTTTLKKTEDEMLDDFLQYFKENNKIPDYRNKSKDMVTCSTYCKYFGSIKNVCDILNIDYDLYINNSGYGTRVYDNNGEICKSIPERDITNYFIDNNIKYEKEYKYNYIISNSNKRFDWKIEVNNKTYYIEYFGLYDYKSNSKICKRYFKRTKKKIRDLYKNNYINRCIFIFPNDLKNKTIDDFFKPYINNNINL